MAVALLPRGSTMKCPCLHSEAAPICRADAEVMRVPEPRIAPATPNDAKV